MIRRLLIVSVLLVSLLSPAVTQAQSGDLLARINSLRTSRGLPPYTTNGALSAAAQSHAQWMADTGVISHNQSDGSGPRSRALNAGYPTADVSENIYGGSQAGVDSAWGFWVNSSLHFNSIVNPRYSEIGIGIATGTVTTYVLVFGNPGGPPPYVPPAVSSGGGGGGGAAAPALPSYIKGQDQYGNIMHEVQPGDTLGDIALIYGYSWGDIQYMRELNNIEGNLLDVGSIFLVPPRDGTFTPTPGDAPENAATPEAEQPESDEPAEPEPPTATATATDTPSPTPGIATAAAMPEVIAVAVSITDTPEPQGTAIAALTDGDERRIATASTITRPGQSPWLIVGLIVQVGVLIVAGVEYARRTRRKGKRR